MTRYEFFIPGEPIAQPRLTQTTARGGKRVSLPLTKKNPRTGRYEPHPVIEYKRNVVFAFQSEHGRPAPITGPIRLQLHFFFDRPQSLLKPKSPMQALYAPVRPDFDNLAKSIMDALNEIAWKDDAQVVSTWIEKKYRAAGAAIGVEVTIQEITVTDQSRFVAAELF